MFEAVFEFLFKYKPFVFERGELVLSASWTSLGAGLLVAVLAIPALRQYAKVGGKSSPRDRAFLAALRVAIFALLFVCLLRPALVVATAVPQQNFVGLLFDDSRSMRIEDLDTGSRSDAVRSAFGAEAAVIDRLAERFKLRSFSFAGSSARTEGVEGLTFGGVRTDLGRALERARQELSSLPLSGLVLVTDGADNATRGLTETITRLADVGVPVYTVGVGQEEFSTDVEIVRVEAPRETLAGSAVGVDVMVRQRGFDGRTVQLFVEDDGRILSTLDVDLPPDGETTVVRARYLAEEPGARLVTFRIPELEREMVAQNNRQEALIRVRDERESILYLEGEPRFEVAFLRRALADDTNLRLALLQRTAENKFYRLAEPVDEFGGENELFAGFPRTREELYAYSGIILGSVEADFFTDDQLRMIADFVSQRGGGLLALGGKRAFARGGFAGTPVGEVLPVVLADPDEAGDEPSVEFAQVRVRPTLFGRSHPAVQLADTAEASLDRWQTLPPLGIVNPLSRTKPGAATLLEGISELLPEPQVVLAYQRYGSGKSIVFTPVDSRMWQMHQDIPLEDQTHETLWRQLLRWLVADVEGQVRARLEHDRFAPGEPVELVARVFDDTYLAVNNARVRATVEAPDGATRELEMEWSVEVDGEYRSRLVADTEGLHRVTVEASRDGEPLGADVLTGQVTELTREFFGAELNRPLLERLAEETRGRFYTLDELDELPDDIRFATGGTTVTEVHDLWDMPAVFLLLVGLIGTEWSYRKLKRLA